VYADYSDNYKDWINYAADVIHYQAQFFPPAPKPSKIVSKFVNFFSSDSDNLQGGVLDAMNGVYLEGDSSSFVTGSRGKFCKTRRKFPTSLIGHGSWFTGGLFLPSWSSLPIKSSNSQ
jgi:hypothetical protein